MKRDQKAGQLLNMIMYNNGLLPRGAGAAAARSCMAYLPGLKLCQVREDTATAIF
jgi:hypothetical protein